MTDPAPTGPLVLAVDLGTGGPKVALVGLDGSVIAHAVRSTELILTDDGGVEQDPGAWWSTICEAIREVVEASGAASAVRAISVTAQWMGTVPVDALGHHLGNAVIWMDSRGAPDVTALVGGRLSISGYEPRKLRTWLRYTGGAPSPTGKDSLGHILWLQRARPDLYAEAETFLEPMDYLNARFCGRKVASFDTISGTWVTDIRNLRSVDYVPELIDLAGIDRAKLPELVPTGSVVGEILPEVADQLGLPNGVAVVSATPDTESAAIGSGAVADFAAHVYIGTSSWVSCHVPFKKTDIIHTIASLPSGIPGRYLAACEQDSAGACLTHLVDNLLYPDDGLGPAAPPDVYEQLNQVAAAVPPGANGVIYTPWLNGERTPVDDHYVRAGFHNLGLGTNRADLVRAVFEGVAYNTRWMHTYVERFAGTTFSPIRFVGGGAQSELWAQILADVLDRPIERMAQPRLANVRGAAFAGFAALGLLAWSQVPDLVEVAGHHHPSPSNRATYDHSYAAFVSLYKRTRRTYAKLNR